jgi:aminomethyltransferase
VALGKGDFVGRSVLERQKTEGVGKKCAAFIMTEKSPPPRPQYPIWSAEPEPQALGRVTSGTQSPSLNIGIGLGYLPPSHARPGTTLQIEIRGRRYPAAAVARPIYKKPV